MAFDNTQITSNAARYTYNPILNSSLGFTITQPLLRGFGIELNRRFIRIAKNDQRIADLVFRQQVIDTVAGIARLYTDLVSLNEDVKVKREALRLAQRLYEDNQHKVEQGQQAPIEVTRAQAQVASDQQALISAQGSGSAAGADRQDGAHSRRPGESRHSNGAHHSDRHHHGSRN